MVVLSFLQAPPVLLTAQTLADRKALAQLERKGTVIFEDGFESADSLASYFDVRGAKEGALRIGDTAHSGKRALSCTSLNRQGSSSGSGVSYWFGDRHFEKAHLRYYIRFKEDYDQGNLNHTGGSLVALAGDNKWRGMGTAGIRPNGDDYCSASFESWSDWGRVQAPGYAFFYTYWMDMTRDKDAHYWGNMLGPEDAARHVLKRGVWTCCEIMIQCNRPGKPDGQLAAWIDGKLYVHYGGIRWRSSAEVLLKRFGLDAYVHQARRDNTVYYDDVVLSTGYIGPSR